MRSPIQVLPVRAMLSLAAAVLMPVSAGAQSGGSLLGTPSAGTLQAPAKPTQASPSKPPSAAPRVPVQQVAPHAKPKPAQATPPHNQAAKPTPVVRPQGPLHAHKPPAAPAQAKPEEPVPPTMAPPQPQAEKPADSEKPVSAGQKLPRFVSLRTDEVNMRAGPGTRYRIDWIYKRRDLPVEVEREFEVWRLVRDPDGIQGWIHQATLTGRRTFIVTGADATLRGDPAESSSAVAILKIGVLGRLRSCEAGSAWCQVQVANHRGYLRRDQMWGLLPDEVVAP